MHQKILAVVAFSYYSLRFTRTRKAWAPGYEDKFSSCEEISDEDFVIESLR